ncbi:MAG: glycosyltransferase [Pseudomonadota bacterium]
MHVAFVAPPLAGHLNPTLALAAELISRGCEATYFGYSDTASKVAAAGVGFADLGPAPAGFSLAERQAMLSGAGSPLTMRRIIAMMAADTRALLDRLPDAFREHAVAAVVSDQLEPAGALVAQHIRVPYASLANALLINRDPIAPPYFTGWPPRSSKLARQMIQGAEQTYDWITSAHGRAIEDAVTRLGLTPQKTASDCLSDRLDLIQIPEAFDLPREAPAPQLAYVGPIRPAAAERGEERADPKIVADIVDGRSPDRPLVFASFGTLFGDRFRSFRTLAEAAKRSGLDIVIADGGRLSEQQRGRLRELGAHVESFVPQRAILGHAAVCVTHGGMNTTMDAMTAEVPVMALPVAFDQMANGARIRHAGVGVVRSHMTLTVAQACRDLQALINDAEKKRAVSRMAHAIAESGGRAQAADLVMRRLAD